MINKTELRIGNIVKDTGHRVTSYCTVQEVGIWIARLHSLSEGIPLALEYGKISPVRLSPEILEKCGFLKSNRSPFRDQDAYEIRINDRSFFWSADNLFKPDINSFFFLTTSDYLDSGRGGVEYLHQLQNIIFALTGTELTINLEKVKV